MIAYKFLRADGTSPFAAFRWDLPDTKPGGWVEARVDPCRSGIHACRPGDLPFWASDSLYEIEVDGRDLGRREQAGGFARPALAADRRLG